MDTHNTTSDTEQAYNKKFHKNNDNITYNNIIYIINNNIVYIIYIRKRVRKTMAKKKRKYDGRKNLIPMNKRSKKERQAIGRKGGKVKSLAKQRASEIRDILNDPNIKGKVKNRVRMLANKNYLGLLNDILATNVKNLDSDKKRLQVIDRILKILPQKNINISAVQAAGFGDEKDVEKLDEFINKVLNKDKGKGKD